MRLYHASPVIVEHPDVLHSRENLDFGRGFYTTALREQAVNYAERFLRRGEDAYVNEYELDDDISDFSIKTLPAYDEEWLEYVALCRKGLSSPDKYDAVSGGIANDKVFNTIDLYFAGFITKEEALARLKYEKPNHQLCILNGQMLERHLRFVKAEKL